MICINNNRKRGIKRYMSRLKGFTFDLQLFSHNIESWSGGTNTNFKIGDGSTSWDTGQLDQGTNSTLWNYFIFGYPNKEPGYLFNFVSYGKDNFNTSYLKYDNGLYIWPYIYTYSRLYASGYSGDHTSKVILHGLGLSFNSSNVTSVLKITDLSNNEKVSEGNQNSQSPFNGDIYYYNTFANNTNTMWTNANSQYYGYSGQIDYPNTNASTIKNYVSNRNYWISFIDSIYAKKLTSIRSTLGISIPSDKTGNFNGYDDDGNQQTYYYLCKMNPSTTNWYVVNYVCYYIIILYFTLTKQLI